MCCGLTSAQLSLSNPLKLPWNFFSFNHTKLLPLLSCLIPNLISQLFWAVQVSLNSGTSNSQYYLTSLLLPKSMTPHTFPESHWQNLYLKKISMPGENLYLVHKLLIFKTWIVVVKKGIWCIQGFDLTGLLELRTII